MRVNILMWSPSGNLWINDYWNSLIKRMCRSRVHVTVHKLIISKFLLKIEKKLNPLKCKLSYLFPWESKNCSVCYIILKGTEFYHLLRSKAHGETLSICPSYWGSLDCELYFYHDVSFKGFDALKLACCICVINCDQEVTQSMCLSIQGSFWFWALKSFDFEVSLWHKRFWRPFLGEANIPFPLKNMSVSFLLIPSDIFGLSPHPAKDYPSSVEVII